MLTMIPPVMNSMERGCELKLYSPDTIILSLLQCESKYSGPCEFHFPVSLILQVILKIHVRIHLSICCGSLSSADTIDLKSQSFSLGYWASEARTRWHGSHNISYRQEHQVTGQTVRRTKAGNIGHLPVVSSSYN